MPAPAPPDAVPPNSTSPAAGGERPAGPPSATRVLRRFAALVLVGLALFGGVRLLFYGLHHQLVPGGHLGEALASFLVGARFDLSAAGMVLLPCAFLASVPLAGAWGVRQQRVALALAVALLTAATLLGVGDCLYYAHAAKRVSYEPLVLWGSGGRLFELAFGEHPLVLGLAFPAVIVAGVLLYRRLRSAVTASPPALGGRAAHLAAGLFATAVLLLCARGGPERLRIGDAYFTSTPVVNHATLNSLVSFVHSLSDDRTLYSFMPERDAVAKVRECVANDAEYPTERFPVLRRATRSATALRAPDAPPLDLCIILVESLSAEVVGFFGDPYGATPNLDRLMAESVVFDRFFSSGSRSSHGLFASLFSVPALLGSPVMHTSLILNRYRGLPTILREAGYHTTFVYGGVYEFTNAEGVLRHAGFEDIIGEPLPEAGAEETSWGYHDGPMFDRLLHELSEPADGPRLTVFFTQSMHNRDLPKDADRAALKERFPKEMAHDKYYRLLAYTDECLGRFLEAARQREFHSRTVYLLLADHSNHKNPNLYDDYRIPFVIHAPGLEPAVYSTTGSQLDVLPTALGLLGIEAEHAAFGGDVLARARAGESGSAYLSFGDSFGWSEGPWLLRAFVEGGAPRLFDHERDPDLLDECHAENPEVAAALAGRAQAFLQLSRQLLVEDRICGEHVDTPGVVH